MTTLEKVIDFWDKRPCNLLHSNKDVGSKEYFQEVTEKKYFIEPHITPFANFEEWGGKRVLEIGCGIGTAAQSFVEAGAIYTGVDISERSLDLARKRFACFGLEGSFYKVEDECLSSVLPVEDYDLVYSFGVIHHTPNPKELLSEIKKYMNKDSVLRIMLYAANSWKAFMIEEGLDQPEAQSGCPIANTYTKSEVLGLLKDFSVTFIKQDHIFPYRVGEYKQNIYIKEPWFRSMPTEIFETLQKNLGWHLLIEAKLS